MGYKPCPVCGASYEGQQCYTTGDACWFNLHDPEPIVVSILDTPPPGHHYDPYKRAWSKNLTEAQVQDLWPYKKKEASIVEPVTDWLEETLKREGLDKTQKDTLTEAPPKRYLTAKDSVVARGAEQEVMAAEVANMLVMVDALPKDNVHLPEHYARFKIEPVRFCIENNLNGFQFNIIKYILRHDAKNGLEDLKKARRYLDMFIKWVEGDEDWWR